MRAEERERLARAYGLAFDGAGVLSGMSMAGGDAIALVNFFKLRSTARYEDGRSEAGTGADAMLRYAATSGRCVAAVGGRFVFQGLATGLLWGDDGEWDLVVVAEYPDADAFFRLLADPDYEQAFVHRRAALERQRVTVATRLP